MRALAFFISFLMAFLLFSVQPMATRMVLPTLGGTAAVWNTVMFTFQLLLLGGYAYAHVLGNLRQARTQFMLHALLLAVSFFFLPLWVNLPSSDALIASPIRHLVAAFMVQIGLPFFCLAATAPLLQSWVSRSAHPLSKTPYVLYSASNLGSFAGLLGYVAVVEPMFDLPAQSARWSTLYEAGAVLLLVTAMRLRPAPVVPAAQQSHSSPVTWRTRGTWIGLAFLPSSLSLGVTTYITTDVASIPLLWVIPLSIYLLSFVDAFRTRPLLVKFCQQIAPLVALTGMMLLAFASSSLTQLFMVHLLLFAVLAFALHGWLAAKRPEAAQLTQFYLCLSVGGALGGVLNGLIAPVIFHEAIEYQGALLVAAGASFILLRRHENPLLPVLHYVRVLMRVAAVLMPLTLVIYAIKRGGDLGHGLVAADLVSAVGAAGLLTLAVFRRYVQAFFTLFLVCLVVLIGANFTPSEYAKLFEDRNFFGVSRVYASAEKNAHYFMHDTTVHGLQSLDVKDRLIVQAYYGPLREVFATLPIAQRAPFAVAGLGAGTLKCLARAGQSVDMYEINPMVMAIAENADYFTYLRDCPGTHRLLLGDARIRIAEQADALYGAMILDAFSSDSIPSHLLTREALAMYVTKLKPGGVLLLNVTNRHIDLLPLLAAQTKALGLVGYEKFFAKPPADKPLMFKSHWVVIAADANAVAPLLGAGWKPLADEGQRPWTDHYVNLLPYFKFLR